MRYVFSLRIVIELTLYIFVEISVRIYGDNVTLISSMIWVRDGDKRKLLKFDNWNLDTIAVGFYWMLLSSWDALTVFSFILAGPDFPWIFGQLLF